MLFWIYVIALALTVFVAGSVLAPRLISDRRARDADVYRDQLTALDKDKARGIVTEAEYAALRAEIARRLLAATDETAPQVTPRRRYGATQIGILCAVGAAIVAYWGVGQPETPDAPLDTRIAQAELARATLPAQSTLDQVLESAAVEGADEDYRALMTQLRETLETRPDDLRGFMLLARGESRLGDFPAAHRAQRRVITLKGDDATAEDWGLYTELMILAAGERISAEAAEALSEILRRDPQAPLARFRLGQLHLQTGRPDLGFRIWATLLEEGPETAPYIPIIRTRIEQIAAQAGIPNYTAPAPRGPSLDDINNAQSLSDEDRTAMIEGMVAGLAERLANEGGPAQDWAQLIRAFGVLGQTDMAKNIYAEATSVFAERPADLERLAQAARAAGITP